ncbi:hypothetical protein [Jeotgalibacillus sp. R-1-5s-1]|uniref:hypothetical protein n=1 Tax=Jeotgalibacillus sp. R-1-5s-1 TaxID=2555897 RepID=UPI00106CC2B7|nr:hypothetical protein [Jeotgalibacillus sp. R-1-5s-1]TFE01930.1 hypothetical protein E2491_03155 [Jeotgalibacillus sp. R-1-5s-1]
MTGLVAVIMIFSIPLAAVITDHFQKLAKLKNASIDKQLKLEQLKHENFLLETEKLRLELEKRHLLDSPSDQKRLS